MSLASLPNALAPIAERFSSNRQQRQQRRHLVKSDFAELAAAGFTRVAVPTVHGGFWESLPTATRPICQALRTLAKGDSSRIYRLSFPISSLVALQSGLDGFLAVEKHLLVKQGIFRNTIIRSPVGFHLDDETKNEVDRLYEILSKVVVETQS